MKIYKINEKNWYETPIIKYKIIRKSDDQIIFEGNGKTAIQVFYNHKADDEECYILKHTIETITEEQLKMEEDITKFNI